MSAVLDVGDSQKITYTAPVGSDVTVDWIDPNLEEVFSQTVNPVSGEPTKYAITLTPTFAGMWTARFRRTGESTDYYIRATSTVGQPPPLAAIGDVSVRYGQLDGEQELLTSYLLKAASKLVRQRFPKIDQQIAGGVLDGDVIAQTVAGMVLRVLWNPEGLRSETTGPFSRAFDTSAAAGLLSITTSDAEALVPSGQDAAAPKFYLPGSIRAVPGMAPPAPAPYGGTGFGGYGAW